MSDRPPERASSARDEPLWRSLVHAAACVQGVRTGRTLDDGLAKARGQAGNPGAVHDLAAHALRHLALGERLLAQGAARPPAEPLNSLLTLALTLLAKAPEKYSEHALVSQAVEAAAALPGGMRTKGFANAVLRGFLRDRANAISSALADPVCEFGHPQWWLDRTMAQYPAQWREIVEANNQPGPMTLRVNLKRTNREALAERWATVGIESRPIGESGLILARARPVSGLPGFDEGLCSVQDEAAQRAAYLLDAQPGMRVLDACAAPGGKTGHILERTDCDVLALDSDPDRLALVSQNLLRLGLSAELKAADAAKLAQWWDGRPFERILLDAPCSASGIVRRQPDIRWLRRPADIARLAGEQRNLLNQLWTTLAPGGRLVYATCSVWKEEGHAQIDAFLQRTPDASLIGEPLQLLPLSADADNHDGFFYAILQK
jgi:16S rRNA (cytosine967-C5)-methyltransferase